MEKKNELIKLFEEVKEPGDFFSFLKKLNSFLEENKNQ